ncbi:MULTISPECIES: hypothetical protein [unclassified Paenibacillus]|uniref:phage tail protein n=1 Tax=unclassified Paenibacillus TaxID=185978 RepID=UPI00240582A3|nr:MULTISPECIES: hypothetical protein [unclassified Paenibacillus]MDF9845171.1 methyl-accepting chemotaxis protein [Paenibacillus sp. PastF-2]MDF9850337.1 methyl-accepting chemotaxis protein [Paenibacillus sp. PastM-2]MDF9856960.1 methyl-accepting chemotaxis protein [Paenibacillus sp. PastF-1]MDH6482183.1 methyl-accepting chemotaxis protein [Paenibacillus sp. PastH-2]MDH6509653.1 methyl-accepting chemotaxis protein [Paenibacillus sp. PastM-3]
MAGGSAGRIDLDLELNYGSFQRQLSGIANTADHLVGNAFKGLGGIIAGAFAVKGLVDFGREAINLASDLQEVQNVVDVTFGTMSAQVDAWSQDLIESFGLSELSAKRYSSTMGAMLKSSGLTGEVVRDMSLGLTQLSADMASFYNLANDEAFYKVFSGLTGEIEPLKQLGINMSVVNMEAYAMTQGISKSWAAMTQAEQTMLRYGYLMKVTADAQGDFARTSNSWANQTRVLTEQWRIFQGTMGAGFINVLTPVIRGLNWLIGKLQIAAQYFRAFTELIFGNAADTSAAAGSTAAAIGGMGTAAGDTAGSMGDMGDATADAGKKTKKAGKDVKGSLAGFDQLNTLAKSTAAAASDAGDAAAAGFGNLGAGLGGGFGDLDLGAPDINVDPVKEKVKGFVADMKQMFGSLGQINLDPLRKSLGGLWGAAKPFAKNVGQGLQWFFNNVLVPLGKWTIEKALPAFLDVLAGGIRSVNSVIDAFKPAAVWLWDTFLQPLAAWTGGIIIESLHALADGLNAVSGWINQHQDAFVKGALLIGGFFAAFQVAGILLELIPLLVVVGEAVTSGLAMAAAMEGLAAAFSAVFSPVNLVAGLITLLAVSFIELYQESETFRQQIVQLGETWKQALEPLATFVSTVLTDAWKQILQPAINFFLKTLLPQLISLFKQLWQQVLIPLANFIGTVLKPVFSILSDLLTMLWKNIILPLAKAVGSVLAEAWKSIYEIMSKTVIPVVGKVIDVLTWLWKNVINPVINVLWDTLKPAFDTVFKGIGTVIEGLKTTLNGVLKFITGVFTGDWGKAWDGVKMIFKGVFDSLYGIVKTPLNLIIDAINAVIKGLNSIEIDLPDWMGGKSFGINIPKIPKLAKGGLAYGPTLAMVGDNRGAAADPEVISPLSTLQEMLDMSNQTMVAVLLQILDAIRSNDKETVIKFGETELGRAAIKAINSVQKQQGRTLLNV